MLVLDTEIPGLQVVIDAHPRIVRNDMDIHTFVTDGAVRRTRRNDSVASGALIETVLHSRIPFRRVKGHIMAP